MPDIGILGPTAWHLGRPKQIMLDVRADSETRLVEFHGGQRPCAPAGEFFLKVAMSRLVNLLKGVP